MLAAAWVGAFQLRPNCGQLRAIGADPAGALVSFGTDRVLGDIASAGLWLTCLWLAFSSAAVAASRLPGTAGALATAVAGRITPRMVRNALAAALGVGIAVSPAVALADPAPAPSLSVAWPLSPDSAPPPAWPVTAPTPAPTPTPMPEPHAEPGSAPGGQPSDVVVRSGDSLWSVAATALGPGAGPVDIAASWPQWYRANVDSIGSDPNLIHPGITLHQPARGEQP